jgi:hypothetical protein
MKGGNSMNYITSISPDFYNPTYFNILESMEYELITYDHQCVMEVFNNAILEADGLAGDATYAKHDGKLKSMWKGITSKATNPDGSKPLTKGQAFIRRMQQYFSIMKQKIKLLLRKFMDKVDELFKLNDKFIRERLHWLKGVDDDFWDGASVTLFDYPEERLNNTIYSIFGCPEIDPKNSTLRQWMMEPGTREEFIDKHFTKVIRCKGPKDGFKEAAKNFFRGNTTSEAKMKVFEGKNDCKKKAEWCYVYLKSYKDKTAHNIRDQLSKINGSMDRVEKDFMTDKMVEYVDNKSAMESYNAILEKITTIPSGTDSRSDSKAKTGDVEYKDANGLGTVQQGGENHTGTRLFEKVKAYGEILLTLQTAQMTVAEEFYFASIHALKHLYKLADDHGFLNKMKADEEKKNLAISNAENKEKVSKANKKAATLNDNEKLDKQLNG